MLLLHKVVRWYVVCLPSAFVWKAANIQVLDNGIPDGAMPGIAGRQVQLKDDENMIPGLLNAQGHKVLQRITVGQLCKSSL